MRAVCKNFSKNHPGWCIKFKILHCLILHTIIDFILPDLGPFNMANLFIILPYFSFCNKGTPCKKHIPVIISI